MRYFILIAIVFSTLSASTQKDLAVYVFLAEECPICIYMGAELKSIADQFDQDVDFYAVFPNTRSHYASAGKFLEAHGLEAYKTILDPDQGYAKKWGAKVTPEAIILDQNQNIVYRGRISDAYYAPGKRRHSVITSDLKNVLQDIITTGSYEKEWSTAVGCYITFRKNAN